MRALGWQTRVRNERKSLRACGRSRDRRGQNWPGPRRSRFVGTRKAVNYA